MASLRFPWQRARRALDLDPLPQRLLQVLARREPADFRALRAEIEAQRPAAPRDTLGALLQLEELALVARLAPEGRDDGGRRFIRTRAGRQVCRMLPDEPRSPTTFYL